VPQDIAQNNMEHLVGRSHETNYLYFIEDELDARGTSHNKPLYITLRFKGCNINKVFMDSDSNLNALLKHLLDEMPVDSMYLLAKHLDNKGL
jgi:hypothetical protein